MWMFLEEVLVSVMGTLQWIWSLKRCWPMDEPKQACRRHLYKTAKASLIRHKVSETLRTHLSLSFLFSACISVPFILPNTHSHSQYEPGSLLGCWLLTQGGLIAELNDRWNTSVCVSSTHTVLLHLSFNQRTQAVGE